MNVTLKCPECHASCFPSASGLWRMGMTETCECGCELMVGFDAEVQVITPSPRGMRRRPDR